MGDIRHASVGTRLTQANWEDSDIHVDASGNPISLSLGTPDYVVGVNPSGGYWVKSGATGQVVETNADAGISFNWAFANGKDIRATSGTFSIGTTILLTNFDKLRGCGPAATQFQLSADVPMIQIGSGSAEASFVELSGLLLDGKARSYSNTSHAVIITSPGTSGHYTNQLLLDNLRIVEFKGKAISGTCTQDSVFRDISVGECGDAGVTTIDLIGNSTIEFSNNTFENLRIDGGEIGVSLNEYCSLNRFYGGKYDIGVNTTPVYGYLIRGRNNLLDGFRVSNPTIGGFVGVKFDEVGGLHCQDNTVSHATIVSTNNTNTRGVLFSSTGYSNTVIDSTIYGWDHGINVSAATNPVIRGNHLYSNNTDVALFTALPVIVEHNEFTGLYNANAVSGVRLNTGYVTENSGTFAINNGATSAVITHGLSITPSANLIHINFSNNSTNDYGNWWISTVGATTFTLNVRSDPGASTLTGTWSYGE